MTIPRLLSLVAVVAVGCNAEPQPGVSGEAPEAWSKPAANGNISPRLVPPPNAATPIDEPPTLLSEEELRDGWITLFDGRTLFGWVANSETPWEVKGSEIVSLPGTPGLLLTTTEWPNYEFRCEAWLAPGGNGGVFFRSVPHPKDPSKDCLEFNLCDTHDSFPTGSLVARARPKMAAKSDGGWHSIHVVMDGDRFTARIDGETVLDETSTEFSETGGRRIGLQQNGGESRFRNVFLKPLGTQPLSDGSSLAGWKMVPGSKSKIAAEAETIHVAGGPGFLESERDYGNFVLQFEAKLNVKDANSGLFFRAEAGTEAAPSNGYELQLQNTVTGGDRTKPADYGDGFGTGAIFRRERARYINAADGEWFAVTLNARENHFASWVNGLQVTDFTDVRKPDRNPRKGRRDKPGRISLQGHDPGTDASFRGLRIAPFP